MVVERLFLISEARFQFRNSPLVNYRGQNVRSTGTDICSSHVVLISIPYSHYCGV